MDITLELEKFCDFAIKVGYLDEYDKSPLINIYMAHFYNSMSEGERQPVGNNEQGVSKCDHVFIGSRVHLNCKVCIHCDELRPV